MRVRSKQTSMVQMYRHFAVVTIVLTALIAVFAEGEKVNALNERTDLAFIGSEPETEERLANETPAQQPGGVWGQETGPSFGGPVNAVQVVSYAPTLPAGLTPEEREELERTMQNSGGIPPNERPNLAALEAASRLRSGSAGLE